MRTPGADTYQILRNRVVTGELAGGTRLVNRTLGKEMGVSHVPVREALHRLVSDGLVEHIPGAGSFVRTVTGEDLSHLYSLRELLEGFAVREACAHATEWQVRVLQKKIAQGHELVDRVRAGGQDNLNNDEQKAWFDHEQELHQAIIDAAANPWLTKMVEQVQLLARVIQSNPLQLTLDGVEAVLSEHEGLVKSIIQKDAEKASALIASHIRTGFENQLLRFEGA